MFVKYEHLAFQIRSICYVVCSMLPWITIKLDSLIALYGFFVQFFESLFQNDSPTSNNCSVKPKEMKLNVNLRAVLRAR